jgi:HEAT repeat protein
LTDALRNSDAHFNVYAAATLSSALEQARRAAAIDLIVLPDAEKDRLTDIARSDFRIANAPVLVAASANALPALKGQLAGRKGFAAVDEKADAPGIMAALQQARGDAGAVSLSPEMATQYAATALDLLAMLAADHCTIYGVNEAVPTLVATLKDKRPEIVTAAARVLGEMNSEDGQRGLASTALASDSEPALRIIFLQQLAESAKHTGNALDASAINGIIKIVSSDPDPKTRLAAATALGALNVPSNQASTLILQQAK